MAKELEAEYRPGDRSVVRKLKRIRTADCVVGGFRYSSGGKGSIGSLLLGLYDGDGLLHHVATPRRSALRSAAVSCRSWSG